MIKIFLDPGHGGKDSGAVGNGLEEKDVTLKIALKIRELLTSFENVSVKMSRTNDQTVSLTERTDLANQWGAQFYLSIHINSGNASGFESFVYPGVGKPTTIYQSIIHSEVIKETSFIDRGTKEADFHVLRESDMDAVLTENGFITTKWDADKLKDHDFLDQIAQGHVDGLVEAFKLKKKQQESNENIETLYRVIIGIFNEKEDTVSIEKEAKEKGFDTYVYNENGKFRVQIGAFLVKQYAEELVSRANKAGLNAVIK